MIKKLVFLSPWLLATTALSNGAIWTAFPPQIDLESLQHPDRIGLRISNSVELRELGRCIAAIGDTNGDGIDDFLIGSRGIHEHQPVVDTPQAFVIYGSAGLSELAEFDVAQLYASNGGDGSLGRVLYREGVFFGESCDGVGDVNADGYDDFVLFGEATAELQYVVFGGPGAVVGAELDLATLEPATGGDGSRGFVLSMLGPGTPDLRLDSTAGGVDFNDDGISDFAVSSTAEDAIYVIFGRDTGFDAVVDPQSLWPANGGDGTAGVVISRNDSFGFFGRAVAMIGDFNGDDVGDIAVSDYGTAGSNSVVVFGSNDLPALIDVASLLPENGGDGSRGIILMNVGSESVGDAGDFNSDGLNDVILRGPGASGFGEAAVVFGDDTPPPTLDVSTLFPNFGGDGSRGVALVGYRPGEDDFIGSWVAGIGDLNGDGIDDVAVNGRERYDIYTDDLFVVYGRVSSPPAIHLFDLTPAGGGTGAEGIIVQSTNPQFAVVFRMAGAGDLNGDGHADLLVTNSFADLFRGRAYLIFGRGDADADGIGDFDDNCIEAANTDQRDTDNDGFGNVCDPDLNNDVIVNFVDLRFLRNAYFSTPIDANWNADADLNGDNAVGFSDMAIMRDTFFGMPGPSALHNSKP